jgi:hypothetical protein
MNGMRLGNRILLLLGVLLVLPAIGIAQVRVTLSGYVRDAKSNEALTGATVYVNELGIGTQTNTYGFYSISMPAGTYSINFSYIGYATLNRSFPLASSQTFEAELQGRREIQEVVVTSERKDENVRGTEMGTISLGMDKIKTLPVIFGESDILKTLQLMPGVQSAGEGNSGFYVRGGGPDQNLILLDDAVVYNTGHLFGFFSVFNSDALKNVTLIKGSMPANYGGRLSSVVDVTMKEGNSKEYHAEGGIGLIASRALIEGPINKGKGSFMISGRRTYIDLLIKPFTSGQFEGSGYHFYDANIKANYKLGPKDRIYLSSYFGRDKFSFANEGQSFSAKIPWGNSTVTLRENHLFNDKVFLNTTLVYNDYKFSFEGAQNNFNVKLSSGIHDWNAKSDLDWFTSGNHHIKAGVAYTYHTFIPNQVSGRSDTTVFEPNNALQKYAHEAAAYILDEFDPAPWLKVNAGLRYSWFGQVGPYQSKTYNANEQPIDSTYYGAGKLVRDYGGFEPRLNLRFALNARTSIKASAVRSNQYIHLVSNNGSTLPTDIWVPSTLLVQPQRAWQYSLGYFQNFFDNSLETSVEVYYKDMRNQVEYRAGYVPTTLRDPELDFVFGRGKAYGAEFFINKTKGRFTGWIGYTLSWTYRYFDQLNNGERFPAKYDRRHDLSLVGSYKLNKKWTFSSVFVFGSGNAITLPTAFYFVEDQLVAQYSKLNAYRIFPYHRLDLSAVYTPQHTKPRRIQGSWVFSIYNVYSRQNPYFLYIDSRSLGNGQFDLKVKQVSIFPILPSITYNFSL